MNFQDVLRTWVTEHGGPGPAEIHNPRIKSAQPGGTCGNDTCHFGDEAVIEWDTLDEDGDHIGTEIAVAYNLAEFITELAAIDRRAA